MIAPPIGYYSGMDLLIIRHAIAEERSEDLPDAARALTRKGRRRFRKIVDGLDTLGVQLGRVLHSPWTRAAETAKLLRPVIAGRTREALVSTDALTGSPRPELVSLIGEHATHGTVAVVGHEPWLSELIALLVLGDLRKGEVFELKKGGVACLDGASVPGGMTLRAHLPPGVLRRI